MKKKLAFITSAVTILCLAAILFAEDARPPLRNSERPARPGMATQRPGPGTRSNRPRSSATDPRTRGLASMIEQQTKRVEAEIAHETKAFETENAALQAILKQANAEKAKKTAKMLNDLIEKKSTESKERIDKIKAKVEGFKQRMKQTQKQQGQRMKKRPGTRNPSDRPRSPRPATPPTNK